MNRPLLFLAFLILTFSQLVIRAEDTRTSVENGLVTVRPAEFQGAINNPLKGFRDYKEKGYGLVVRQYIPWNEIEVGEGDIVDHIIAHTNEITRTKGKNFEDLNLKLVPRVYLDWDGSEGTAENRSNTGPPTSTASTTTVLRFKRDSGPSWPGSAQPGTPIPASSPCRWD